MPLVGESPQLQNYLRIRLLPAQIREKGGHSLRWRIKCQKKEGSGTVNS